MGSCGKFKLYMIPRKTIFHISRYYNHWFLRDSNLCIAKLLSFQSIQWRNKTLNYIYQIRCNVIKMVVLHSLILWSVKFCMLNILIFNMETIKINLISKLIFQIKCFPVQNQLMLDNYEQTQQGNIWMSKILISFWVDTVSSWYVIYMRVR